MRYAIIRLHFRVVTFLSYTKDIIWEYIVSYTLFSWSFQNFQSEIDDVSFSFMSVGCFVTNVLSCALPLLSSSCPCQSTAAPPTRSRLIFLPTPAARAPCTLAVHVKDFELYLHLHVFPLFFPFKVLIMIFKIVVLVNIFEEGYHIELHLLRSILISLGLDYSHSLDLRDSPEASASPENGKRPLSIIGFVLGK